jgi:hypothetical protein
MEGNVPKETSSRSYFEINSTGKLAQILFDLTATVC